MNIFSSVEENKFEAKIKIVHNNNQKELIEIINNYLKRFYDNEQYNIEKETQNLLILNFKDKTEIANCVLRFLKIIRLEKYELSNIKCSIHIKIINSFSKNKFWNKPLLSSSSTLDNNNKYIFPKNQRYKNYSKKKNNFSTNNTKYNVIESIYFFNVNKKENFSNKNNYSDTENNLNQNNNASKKGNNNWLIQIKSNLNNDNYNNNIEIENNNKEIDNNNKEIENNNKDIDNNNKEIENNNKDIDNNNKDINNNNI